MHNKLKEAEQLKKDLLHALTQAKGISQVEEIRIRFLGKQGSITLLLAELKDLPVEEKRHIGQAFNSLKKESDSLVQEAKSRLQEEHNKAITLKKQYFDVTAYQTGLLHGHLHPFTQFTEEVENIFLSMGYDLFDGPEVDTDFYNFEALNIPPHHPARDMYDTLWLNSPGLLMRTHTSPVQVHALENNPLPLAGIAIGRVFRHEAIDASHDMMFMQCEGIVVDRDIALSDLFGTAQHFLQKLFNTSKLDIRIRPGYFPFVEPGVEIDMRCQFCTKGCSVCKQSTWVEIFPGGLIHPKVLHAVGIDTNIYSGFAFGFGFTRLAMLKYGISDIRLFHSGKNKFLHQF